MSAEHQPIARPETVGARVRTPSRAESPVAAPAQAAALAAVGRLPRVPAAVSPELVLMLQRTVGNRAVTRLLAGHPGAQGPQRAPTIQRKIEANKLNIVGEGDHDISDKRRPDEKKMVQETYGFPFNKYWAENEFTFTVGKEEKHGDNHTKMVLQCLSFVAEEVSFLQNKVTLAFKKLEDTTLTIQVDIRTLVQPLKEGIGDALLEVKRLKVLVEELDDSPDKDSNDDALIVDVDLLRELLIKQLGGYLEEIEDCLNEEEIEKALTALNESIGSWKLNLAAIFKGQDYDVDFAPIGPKHRLTESQLIDSVSWERSRHMYFMAREAAETGKTGVWKVGDSHVHDLQGEQSAHVAITSHQEFETAYVAWEKDKDKEKATAKEQG